MPVELDEVVVVLEEVLDVTVSESVSEVSVGKTAENKSEDKSHKAITNQNS